MKDKKLRGILFGRDCNFGKEKKFSRSCIMTFGIAKDGEKHRSYIYRGDDGFVLYLIEMIEKLEERIKILESKKK